MNAADGAVPGAPAPGAGEPASAVPVAGPPEGAPAAAPVGAAPPVPAQAGVPAAAPQAASAEPPGRERTFDASGRERTFEARGGSWLARVAGEGLGGTGRLGPARFSILHFFVPGEATPRYQALVPAGQLPHLFERELAELLERAQPVVPPER